MILACVLVAIVSPRPSVAQLRFRPAGAGIRDQQLANGTTAPAARGNKSSHAASHSCIHVTRSHVYTCTMLSGLLRLGIFYQIKNKPQAGASTTRIVSWCRIEYWVPEGIRKSSGRYPVGLISRGVHVTPLYLQPKAGQNTGP
ncbi:hypothetical protein HPB48_001065 [Haemaphysalis longicornis]|uniref:Secreted protein n=1 Tax=Haemaphysalis longicornis TaxID=44386 RepID=A0A9J6GY85_HAELO|nr:hypothetical protein HPB48_001065 [Haemaphysalis longicornis]